MIKTIKDFIGPMTIWKGILFTILALGFYATVIRFFVGLGASTNLSDEFPWGLWIGFSVLSGVGLASGGFIIAATVHIFQLKKYESIARPTILGAFLGYVTVVCALMFEVGLPYRLWHPLVMWNPHSVLFEVAWCVMLYTTVLLLEFSPVIFERLGLRAPLKLIRAVYLPLVIAGVLLSTLHQSSLGTLYVIAPDKLYGLWYSPFLPVFFFISSIAAGLALIIIESFLCYRAFGRRIQPDILEKLAQIVVVALIVYGLWKLQDLIGRDNWRLMFALTPESVLFWGEVGLGVVLPVILLSIPAVRRNETGIFLGAMLTIMGFLLNRSNVAITGMMASSGVNYFPSWMEVTTTVMLVAIGFTLFTLGVKYLPVFPEADLGRQPSLPMRKPVFRGRAIAGLWVLVAIGIACVNYAAWRNEGRVAQKRPSAPLAQAGVVALPASLRLPGDHTFTPKDDSVGPVLFRHSTHMKRNDVVCASCHRTQFKMLAAAAPVRGEITEERAHRGDLCGSCHNGVKAFSAEDECDRCHK
ncbi:MAG TPA: Ni/Fe-hydrogenase cytochrome b subunit [Bdellovibrionota bacterium]|nr:Ni/Fe-hydrogenase cytochrome b subunit [Bdellovibrionota bacterium]